MEPIIEEIDKSLLAEEIKGQVCLQELSRGKMQLYVLEGYKAPALMKEIGRLREIAFRTAGGGTGMSCDVDRYDLDSESGFRQLICWDSENCEVMGGYRILFGKVTFYPSYPSEALGLLEAFFSKHCPDHDSWIVPHNPYVVPIPDYADSVLVYDSYESDLKALTGALHDRGFDECWSVSMTIKTGRKQYLLI